MKGTAKTWIAVGMAFLSGVVLILTFGTPGSGSRPIAPALAPMFGWQFGLVFGIFQLGFAYYFDIKKAILLVVGIWAIIAPLISLGTAFRWSPLAVSGLDRLVTGAACASALALGVAIWKGKL